MGSVPIGLDVFPLIAGGGLGRGFDAVKLGSPVDLYSKEVKKKEIHLLDFWPEPGRYVLRLECTGKNLLSKGYYLGIESVRLRQRRPRVRRYAHDRDKEWREERRLYG